MRLLALLVLAAPLAAQGKVEPGALPPGLKKAPPWDQPRSTAAPGNRTGLPKGILVGSEPFDEPQVAPPEIEVVTGELRSSPRNRKRWGSHDFELWVEDRRSRPLAPSQLVSREELVAAVGKRVEVVLHPLPHQDGYWKITAEREFMAKPSSGPGTGAPQPVELDGEVLAWADWVPAFPQVHEVLRLRVP